MASAVDSRLAYARLSAVATASRLPTANRGSNNSYTTSWDTTGRSAGVVPRASIRSRRPRRRLRMRRAIMSDPDSRLMRKSKHHEYRQAHNAQAAVDAGGSQLIVGARVSQCASDRNDLVADIEAIPAALGRPETVLADNGYANGAEVAAPEASGIEALVSTSAEGRRRTHDFRPVKALPAAKEPKADWLKAMAEKLASEEGRASYKLRRQTVEPVFGVIKAVLGFAGFSLRGLEKKVEGEWTLVALAYNCKRLHKLSLAV